MAVITTEQQQAADRAKSRTDTNKNNQINGAEATSDAQMRGGGSIAELLFGSLVEIGGWDPQSILIEKLPEDLYENLSAMAQEFYNENEVIDNLLGEFFKEIIGESYNDSGGEETTSSGSGYSGPKKKGRSLGSFEATGYGPPWVGDQGPGITAKGTKLPTNPTKTTPEYYLIAGDPTVLEYGKYYFIEPNPHNTDAPFKMDDTGGPEFQGGKKRIDFLILEGSKVAYDKWGRKPVKVWEAVNAPVETALVGGKKTTKPTENLLNPDAIEVPVPSGTSGDDESDADQSNKSGTDTKKVIRQLMSSIETKGAPSGGLPLANLGRAFVGSKFNVGSGFRAGDSGDHGRRAAIDLSCGWEPQPSGPSDAGLDKLYAFIVKHLLKYTKQVIYWKTDWYMGQKRAWTANDHLNHVHVALKDEYLNKPEAIAAAIARGLGGKPLANWDPDSSAESTGDPVGDVASEFANGGGSNNGFALAAMFNLPGIADRVTSGLLGGERALMNDMKLFPFVQQICESSLREFQSLPDGRFHAFYPDYFGEYRHRPAHWSIKDIEILDGKINLSDEDLVTHQYVVGSQGPTSQPLFNKLKTAGVVTIYNAFVSDTMLNRGDPPEGKSSDASADSSSDKKSKKGTERIFGTDTMVDMTQANAFLRRYGPRVEVVDNAFIFNRYFEFLSAYQRFMLGWSRQFLTPFSFTFMPEIYPGGKVAFPDHKIQMYVEEVVHEFSYESGFTTRANLSAPSTYGSPKNKNPALPDNMARAIVAPLDPTGREKDEAQNSKDKKK